MSFKIINLKYETVLVVLAVRLLYFYCSWISTYNIQSQWIINCPGENRSSEEDVTGAQRGLPEGLAGESTGGGKQNTSQRHIPGHIQEPFEVRKLKDRDGEHINIFLWLLKICNG